MTYKHISIGINSSKSKENIEKAKAEFALAMAAPDLLKALIDAADAIRTLDSGAWALQQAEAAISKAEQGQFEQ